MTGKSPSFLFKQLACKPDSVRFWFLQEILKPDSIIYLGPVSLPCSYDLPPGIGRAVLGAGIHGLSTHKVYGSGCHHPNR